MRDSRTQSQAKLPDNLTQRRERLFEILSLKITSSPFGENTEIVESKSGGVNNAGPKGGVAKIKDEHDGTTHYALIKRDTKGTKVRAAKVLAEAIAGKILWAVYEKLNQGDTRQLAKVDLIRADEDKAKTPLDETGEETYLRSIFIQDYKDDLWKYAYKLHYKSTLMGEISKARTDEEKLHLSRSYAHEFKKCYQTALRREENKVEKSQEELEKSLAIIDKRLMEVDDETAQNDPVIQTEFIKISYLTKLMTKSRDNVAKARERISAYEGDKLESTIKEIENKIQDQELRKSLATELAIAKANAMTRPSGVTNLEARKIVSAFIRSKERYRKEFAKHIARRLWLNDLGLHNANLGVQKPGEDDRLEPSIDMDSHIVSLDFGAAGNRLDKEVNPFDRFKVGLSFHQSLYKHHVLEYDNDLITSIDMAEAFLELGSLSDDDIRKFTISAIDEETRKLGIQPLIKYCQRIDMPTSEYNNINDRNALIAAIKKFSCERYISRARSLKKDGYALLLEHCVDKSGYVIESQLHKYLDKYPDLYEFALTRFKNIPLVVSQNTRLPSLDYIIKRNIIQAIGKRAPVQNNLPYYLRLLHYYNFKAECAFYSMKGYNELTKIKQVYDKLQKDMEELRAMEKSLTREQYNYLLKCEELLATINEYLTNINKCGQIRHFSDQSYVIDNVANSAELDARINTYVAKWLKYDRGEQQASLPVPDASFSVAGTVPTTGPFTAGHSARVNLTSIDEVKSAKPVNFVSVQRVKNGVYRSDFYFDPKKVEKLGKEACLIIAVKEISNFRAGNPHPEKPIIITGNMPRMLVEAIIDYCESQIAKGETGYRYINHTRFHYTPSKSRIKSIEQRLEDKADVIFGAGRGLAMSNKELDELHTRTSLFRPTSKPSGAQLNIEPAYGDGNCAFNAFILAIAQPSVLAKIQPPDEFVTVACAALGLDKNDSNWDGLKSKILSMRDNNSIDLQKALAPLMRQITLDEAEKNRETYYDNTIEPLLSAFHDHVLLHKFGKMPEGVKDDIFSLHSFIVSKFNELSDPIRSEADIQSVQEELRKWWQETGFNAFIANMRKSGTFAGDLELNQLARYFNLNLISYLFDPNHVRNPIEFTVRSYHGTLPDDNLFNNDIKKQLLDRGVISRPEPRPEPNATGSPLTALSKQEMLLRLDAVPEMQQVLDFIVNNPPLTQPPVPANWSPELIKQLESRNVISRKGNNYTFNNLPVDEITARITAIPAKERIEQAWEMHYKNPLAITLMHTGHAHWNNMKEPIDVSALNLTKRKLN